MIIKMQNKYKSNECSICYRPIHWYNRTTLKACGHQYHTKCIKKWYKKATTCPICRVEQNIRKYCKVKKVRNLSQNYYHYRDSLARS